MKDQAVWLEKYGRVAASQGTLTTKETGQATKEKRTGCNLDGSCIIAALEW
jgi:hypothetical protein